MNKENPAQPIFFFARAVLDECEKQADRWLEHGIHQVQESVKIARSVRAQMTATSKSMLDTVEQMARGLS